MTTILIKTPHKWLVNQLWLNKVDVGYPFAKLIVSKLKLKFKGKSISKSALVKMTLFEEAEKIHAGIMDDIKKLEEDDQVIQLDQALIKSYSTKCGRLQELIFYIIQDTPHMGQVFTVL